MTLYCIYYFYTHFNHICLDNFKSDIKNNAIMWEKYLFLLVDACGLIDSKKINGDVIKVVYRVDPSQS